MLGLERNIKSKVGPSQTFKEFESDNLGVLMSVHLEFFPSDVQGMLRHFEIIKGFQTAEKDGIEYDYPFRGLKSRNADIVWGKYITELQFCCRLQVWN